jgi:hypothetical protein
MRLAADTPADRDNWDSPIAHLAGMVGMVDTDSQGTGSPDMADSLDSLEAVLGRLAASSQADALAQATMAYALRHPRVSDEMKAVGYQMGYGASFRAPPRPLNMIDMIGIKDMM